MPQEKTSLTARIQKGDQFGYYVGYIVEVGGMIAQAKTADECYSNLLEAVEGMLKYKLPNKTMADITVVRADV